MNINIFNFFAINIATRVLSFIYYQTTLTSFFSFMTKTEPNKPDPTIRKSNLAILNFEACLVDRILLTYFCKFYSS